MNTRQLRHFVAVAETLHFGQAAERFGMTQPPLSQSILALERELGSPLFVRTKRSVALTPFGGHWLPHVVKALESLSALAGVAKRLRDGIAGELAISFVSTADYSILPSLVRRYASLFPDVEISLTEATSDVQIGALLEGKGHAGLVIPPPDGLLPEPLSYCRLLSEPLAAAVPTSWIEGRRLPLVRGRLPAEAAVAAPLIIFPRRSSPAFHDLVTGYYLKYGGRARIVQEAIQMQTIISLVSAGMGIALVPQSLRNLARTGVRYVDLVREAPTLETGVVWRRDDTTATLRQFLQVARGEVGNQAAKPAIRATSAAGDSAPGRRGRAGRSGHRRQSLLR